MEHHLQDSDEEDGGQRNGTRHSRVVIDPKVAQARISERNEGGGQKMNEGSRDKNASTEVADEEEEPLGDMKPRELLGEQREGARQGRGKPDDEKSTDVKRSVVLLTGDTTGSAAVTLAEMVDDRLLGLDRGGGLDKFRGFFELWDSCLTTPGGVGREEVGN